MTDFDPFAESEAVFVCGECKHFIVRRGEYVDLYQRKAVCCGRKMSKTIEVLSK